MLVILRQRTTDIDSVLSLYMNAPLRVSKRHTRAAHLMSKMACCFTTSKFLVPFYEYFLASHVHISVNFLYKAFTCLFCILSRHAHYQAGITPLALVWKDEACSQYVIDTDSKGEIPSEQQVCFFFLVLPDS